YTKNVAFLVSIVFLMMSLNNIRLYELDQNEEWRSAIVFLSTQKESSAEILVSSKDYQVATNYYYPGFSGARCLDRLDEHSDCLTNVADLNESNTIYYLEPEWDSLSNDFFEPDFEF